MPNRATSIDVAKRAGVSQATVSRTFSGASVAAATRARVMTAARDLNYSPSAIARSMSTQATGIIGIVMADISSPFYPYVLEKFTSSLQALGQRVLLFNVPPDQDVDAVLPTVLEYRVDGLIITSTTLSSAMAEICVAAGTPVILFNRYVLGSKADAVCCDNVEGGRMIANALLDGGHTRLAYIAGKLNTSTNQDREKGFGDRLRERGVIDWQHAQGDYTYPSGYAAARELLAATAHPDAIFCANDIMALGALDCARDLSINVPGELSIVGFDDIPAASWSGYQLTTVRQPVNHMIEATLDILARHRENPDAKPTLQLVPGRLVTRRSARIAEG